MANSTAANLGGLPPGIQDKLNSVKLSYLIEEAENKTYRVELYMPLAGSLDTIYYKTLSGTCTLNVEIDGTSVTSWSALSVTSTEANTASTGADTWAGGESLTLIVTSNSSALELQITILGTLT